MMLWRFGPAPIRLTTMPASGIAIIDPDRDREQDQPQFGRRAASASRICGIRDAQLAKPNPLAMKAT